jgi:protein AroM
VSRPVVAAVTIGQSPRPDLLESLLDRIDPRRIEVRQYGALDEIDAAALPAGSIREPRAFADAMPGWSTASGDGRDGPAYPLTTRLRDGRSVTLDETFLAPRVQAAVERAERDGAVATLLLCAGGFAVVEGRRPLVRPFELAVATLRSLGLPDVAVAVPDERQVPPAERKYIEAGLFPVVRAAAPGEVPDVFGSEVADGTVGAVVLDYVGHPLQVVDELRGTLPCPLVDLGDLAAAVLSTWV